MHLLLHFFVPTVQLLHQCEVISHVYESFHAGTSNNIWVFLWWLYIYSRQNLLICYFTPIDCYRSVS